MAMVRLQSDSIPAFPIVCKIPVHYLEKSKKRDGPNHDMINPPLEAAKNSSAKPFVTGSSSWPGELASFFASSNLS